MRNLLIETSSKIIEFGYAEGGNLIFHKRLDEEENADTLTYFIKDEFDKRNFKIREIEAVSLSNGPGSFTGLRIGSAISKGICAAGKAKLIEVITLDVIANKFFLLNKEINNCKLISLIFSRSSLNEFYYSEYEIISGKIVRTSDYLIDTLENINFGGKILVTNDEIREITSEEVHILEKESNIPALHKLSLELITGNKFSDYGKSGPFYLKDFVVLNQRKKSHH
jgi:tRNA threonylcarbamoyladenosine biosynthesis protein TsaB